MKGPISKILAPVALLGLASVPAHAAVINVDNDSPDNIPGLTGFSTTGAEMVGMEVTASFGSFGDAGPFSETLSWSATDAVSGGVSGDGWSLTQSGNTFSSLDWNFANGTNRPLTNLTLNGIPGLTVFDRAFDPFPGTTGSADGLDFETGLTLDSDVVATYADPVGIGGKKPVGDIFHTLTVDFTGLGDGGAFGDFAFTQDTDNDSRILVPLPGTIALFGLGLLGLGAASRRR